MDEDLRTTIPVAQLKRSKNEPKTFLFGLIAEGHQMGDVTVAIDRHYPDEVAERVARTFLYRRLLALVHEAECQALTDVEMKSLWVRYKPAHYP